jgi:hypothetical protein
MDYDLVWRCNFMWWPCDDFRRNLSLGIVFSDSYELLANGMDNRWFGKQNPLRNLCGRCGRYSENIYPKRVVNQMNSGQGIELVKNLSADSFEVRINHIICCYWMRI